MSATPQLQHPAQPRILVVLSVAQATGGIANGAALGIGALLISQVVGSANCRVLPQRSRCSAAR